MEDPPSTLNTLSTHRANKPSVCEKYETANWSLRQGAEEVNKRIKQKDIYLNK